jgi:methyl-accepting chemotaxis protein
MALSVLPVIGTGVAAYFISANNLEATERDEKASITKAFNINLARFLGLRVKDVETISSLPLFADPKISATATLQTKEEFLTEFQKRYKFYSSIMVFDLAGNPIAASEGTTKSNHADRSYFQAAIKTQKSQMTAPQLSKSTGKMVFHIATPIFDPSNKLSGVIRASMPVEAMDVVAQAFDNKEVDLTWHIIDRETNRLLRTNDETDLKTDDTSQIFGESYGKYKASETAIVVQDREKGEKNLSLTSYQAMPEITGVGSIPLTVSLAQDMKFIYAKENQVLLVLGLGILVAGGLTIGASLFLSSRIAKYIQKIANNITDSAGNIVSTVNNQANSAIETTGTVNQLGSISFQASEQAEASAYGARQALTLAEAGTQSVQQTLQGMNGLQQKVNEIANQIVDLSAQTGQIANVSDLVADLANQTNMLALNAAVEAARAGEQGKGFSVVAGEIRKLADQSKQSAERINALAEDIQTAINRTVMVTDEGTKQVQQGIDLAQNTAATFIGVSDAINNVFLNSQQISSSAKQQAVAIQQVLGAMTSITQGSQESAVGMHQVKVNTQELNYIADELKAAVV